MRPIVTPVQSQESVPDHADLVIIGGGIVGCSAALWAAEQGLRVALLEKGRIAGEQSGRNWGWVRRMGRARAEYPLGIESLRIWEGLASRTSRGTGFRRSGIVYGAATSAELAWLDRVEKDAQDFDLNVRRLGRSELATSFPGASLTENTALLTHDDGRAEPGLATAAIALGAQDAGAAILQGCAARCIEMSAGQVSSVITERGPIKTDLVILAGGAWSRVFAGNLGVDLPQLRVRGSVLRTSPVANGPSFTFGNGQFGIRPRLDGGYTIAQRGRSPVQITPDAFRLMPKFLAGLRENSRDISLTLDASFWQAVTMQRRWSADAVTPFERCRVLDPDPRTPGLEKALSDVKRSFPMFRDARIVEQWGGIIDVTPDGVPIIDHISSVPGLVVATGFSGHGFGIGPAAGQLAVELGIGARPLVDPAPFQFSRFDRKPKTSLAAAQA